MLKIKEEIFTVNKAKFMVVVILGCLVLLGAVEFARKYPEMQRQREDRMLRQGLVKYEGNNKKVIDIHIPTKEDISHIHTPKTAPKNPKTDKDKARKIKESV